MTEMGVPSGWRPTELLFRGVAGAAVLALVAVVAGRPDLLVLAVPLGGFAVPALLRRPAAPPEVVSSLGAAVVAEGQAVRLRVVVTADAPVEHLTVSVPPVRWVRVRPSGGVVGVAATPGAGRAVSASVHLAPVRWGARRVGEGHVAALSPWAGWVWGPQRLQSQPMAVVPRPARFEGTGPPPHPVGLVGLHPARRPGSGSELEDIREFQPGDRVRRVHWRVSRRTGRLHVTTTRSEEDAAVVLLVDAGSDVGDPPATSVDTAVRAAAGVAEHHLRRGDRVALRVLGSAHQLAVPASTGRRHLHRVLHTLARVAPGSPGWQDPGGGRFHVPAGAVALVLSPLLAPGAVVTTTRLARSGVTVVVVDTLPEVAPGAPHDVPALAWRMRLLERDHVVGRLRRSGVPVVPWRGGHPLDEVLRTIARRAARARTVPR